MKLVCVLAVSYIQTVKNGFIAGLLFDDLDFDFLKNFKKFASKCPDNGT